MQRLCYNDPSSYLFGCRVVNFVHDEIIIEAPEEKTHTAALVLQETMIEVFNRWTPDVPVRATPVAMRRWSKDATPTHNSKGILIPWS